MAGFEWAKYEIADELLEEAMKKVEEEELSVIGTIVSEMVSDTEDESWNLLSSYKYATEEERHAIDGVLVYLCGWSFPTIVKKFLGLIEEEEEED